MLRVAITLLAVLCCVSQGAAQNETAPSQPMPHDYLGPSQHIDGLWITPVAGAPFTATVQIVSHNKLPDGTEHIVKTENYIARSSSGRIRNERRALVSPAFTGKPRLLAAHIYDPNTRVDIYTDPLTLIARQVVLPQPLRTPAGRLPPTQLRTPPGVTSTPLGDQTLTGVQLQGTRKTRVISAEASGLGKPVTIVDDYWYSPELSIYLIIRHDDPRTGEQMVAVTQIERHEPAAEMLTVPSEYKIVDETPPERHTPVLQP